MKRGRLGVACGIWLGALASPAPADCDAQSPHDLTELSLAELANIEVTSVSKKPEKRSRVAAAVHVITREDIRRAGATSLAEALRLAPGVQVARVNSNQWAIGIRGFASQLSRSLLVLMDGRSVYTPLFAGVYWDVQDALLEDIDRIEVIRGPGGTLWGANAVNGVVNVITRGARDTQGVFIQAGAGSEERGFGGIRYGGQAGAVAYRVYGKYWDRGPGFHASGPDFDAWHMGQGGFRAAWDPDPENAVTVQGDIYAGRAGRRTTLTGYAPPFTEVVHARADLSGGNVLGRWQHAFPAGSRLSTQLYYDRTHRSEANFSESRDTFDLDLQHQLKLSADQDIVWGIGYRTSNGRTGGVPTVTFDPADRSDDLFSGFVQDEIGLVGGRLRVAIGAKGEHNDYSGFEVQPSARLLWQPQPRQIFWLAASRSVRTPSRVEHDLAVTSVVDTRGPVFARVLGNKGFGPEKAVAYEAGYRTQPRDNVSLDVAGFYNRYRDLLSAATQPAVLESSPLPPHFVIPVVLRNGLEGEAYGVEVAADFWPADRWRLSGAYSYLRLDLRASAGSIDSSRSSEGASPRNLFSVRSALDLPSEVSLDASLRYVDELPAQQVPSYTSLDVRVAWRPSPSIELSAVGQNLLDGHHLEFAGGSPGSVEVERGAYVGVGMRW